MYKKFGLRYLFYGISTFIGYLMPEPSSQNKIDTI